MSDYEDMDYLEDVRCPNAEFHSKNYLILRDMDDSLIYHCGCGCKFEWYGNDNVFIVQYGRDYEGNTLDFQPRIYRPYRENKVTSYFSMGMIVVAVAATITIGAIAMKVILQ